MCPPRAIGTARRPGPGLLRGPLQVAPRFGRGRGPRAAGQPAPASPRAQPLAGAGPQEQGASHCNETPASQLIHSPGAARLLSAGPERGRVWPLPVPRSLVKPPDAPFSRLALSTGRRRGVIPRPGLERRGVRVWPGPKLWALWTRVKSRALTGVPRWGADPRWTHILARDAVPVGGLRAPAGQGARCSGGMSSPELRASCCCSLLAYPRAVFPLARNGWWWSPGSLSPAQSRAQGRTAHPTSHKAISLHSFSGSAEHQQ